MILGYSLLDWFTFVGIAVILLMIILLLLYMTLRVLMIWGYMQGYHKYKANQFEEWLTYGNTKKDN